jgi:hypothetical protein
MNVNLGAGPAARVARRIDEFAPDCLHIATEGPLGWLARGIARRRGWPFSTAYHNRFPECVHARFRVPTAWSYALLRRLHNAGRSTTTPTPAIVADLRKASLAGLRPIAGVHRAGTPAAATAAPR